MTIQKVLLIPLSSVTTDKTLENSLAKNARILSVVPIICMDDTYIMF